MNKLCITKLLQVIAEELAGHQASLAEETVSATPV